MRGWGGIGSGFFSACSWLGRFIYYYMRVYHRCFLKTCMRGWGKIGCGFFPACSWLVSLVAGVGCCVLAGVEIEGWSCIFLYFGGC